MNWEFVNKVAFLQCVQTWLLKSDLSGEECVRVLFEAQRCRQTTLPMDLPQVVRQFIEWQILGAKKPEWVSHPGIGGIP